MGKGFKLTVNPPVSGSFHYAGQEVTGKVTIKNSEPKKYIRVEIRFTGEALVKIGDVSGWEKEELINHQVILWDREQAPNKEFPPGEHNLPFSVRLHSPRLGAFIPTTYESPFAKVVYAVEACIVKEGKLKRDSRLQEVINVMEIVDINRQDLLQPKAQVTDRDLAYTSLSSGSPVSVTVRLPRTGFSIHNDNITFEVEVSNPKKRRTGPVTVQLFKDSKYGNSSKYANRRNFNRIVRGASATNQPPKSNPLFKWNGSITVPFTEPTSSCSSVRVGYYLNIVLTIPMTNSGNMCMTFPITIGTVPFRPPAANPGRQLSHYQPLPPPAAAAAAAPMSRYYSQPALDTYPAAAGQQYPPQPYSPQSAQYYPQQPYSPQQLAGQPPYSPQQPVAGQPYPAQPYYNMPTQPPYSPESQPPPAAAAAAPPSGEWAAPPPHNPYWDPNQASVTLPRHWTHSPPVGEAPGEEGPPLPPPPSYDETVTTGAFPSPRGSKQKLRRLHISIDSETHSILYGLCS